MAERFQFTPDRLRAIKPGSKLSTYRDTKVTGLIVIVTPAGSKTFYLYRRINGKPKRVRIGRFPELSVRQVRERANRLYAEVEGGTFKEKPSVEAYGFIHKLYVEDAKKRIKTWKGLTTSTGTI